MCNHSCFEQNLGKSFIYVLQIMLAFERNVYEPREMGFPPFKGNKCLFSAYMSDPIPTPQSLIAAID